MYEEEKRIRLGIVGELAVSTVFISCVKIGTSLLT